jgi:diguanylate cyclase (GGDEF)-like protein
LFPAFAEWTMARIVLSSLIVATYTFLTSAELSRERRRQPVRRWPAVLVPILHGAVFLTPIPLVSMLSTENGIAHIASGWIAVFLFGAVLYVVGTAFIGLTVAKERAVRMYKDAAMTDELTGFLNRRGFMLAAESLIVKQVRLRKPASVLMCDLDKFKSINDRFGHDVGDSTLRLFGRTARVCTRTTDILGRLGGEEFAAILPGTIDDAAVVANRLRAAFEAAGSAVAGCSLDATVSIGIASGLPGTDLKTLLARADAALYRAKNSGRNRIEVAPEASTISDQGPAQALEHRHRHVREHLPKAQGAL